MNARHITGSIFALASLTTGCGKAAPGACEANLMVGDLVITEVMADADAPSGQSTADEGREWIEIYNPSDQEISLAGLVITHSKADGTAQKFHEVVDAVIGARGYLVVGNVTPDLAPAWVQYGYGAELGDLYNSGAGTLALTCGSRTIDTVTYASMEAGRSRQLDGSRTPDAALNDSETNWCDATMAGSEEYLVANFGTPGDANEACITAAQNECNDNGVTRAIEKPGVGDLVISEVMPSPDAVADAAGEWIELTALRDVDLNGVSIDRAGDSAAADLLGGPNCLRVTAGSHVVLARADAANGGLPAPVGLFTFSLVAGSMTSPGDVQVLVGTTVVDAVTWTASTSGASLQVDPDFLDPAGNDDAGAWCVATTAYGDGDLGSPGAVNNECAVVPVEGQCLEGGNLRPIVKPPTGALVISEIMASPAGDDTKEEWIELQNAGIAPFDLNGLGIDRTDDNAQPQPILATDCKSVAPGAFALLARSATNNDGLPDPDALFSFSLTATSGLQIVDGATVVDAVTWSAAANGAARQLDPGSFTTSANDELVNWCDATASYGATTNRGTPRAANTECL